MSHSTQIPQELLWWIQRMEIIFTSQKMPQQKSLTYAPEDIKITTPAPVMFESAAGLLLKDFNMPSNIRITTVGNLEITSYSREEDEIRYYELDIVDGTKVATLLISGKNISDQDIEKITKSVTIYK